MLKVCTAQVHLGHEFQPALMQHLIAYFRWAVSK